MIELWDMVAAPGLSPVEGKVGLGEVVVVEAESPHARRRFFSVLAGQAAASAGRISYSPGVRPREGLVLLRHTDVLLPTPSAAQALVRYAAAWGYSGAAGDRRVESVLRGHDGHDNAEWARQRPEERETGCTFAPPAVAAGGFLARCRGHVCAPRLWLVDLDPGLDRRDDAGATDGALIQDLVARARAGLLTLIVASGSGGVHRGDADQVWLLSAAANAPADPRPKAPHKKARQSPLSFAAFTASVRVELEERLTTGLQLAGLVVTMAALMVSVGLAHEGYWYPAGEAQGLTVSAYLSGYAAALIAVVAAMAGLAAHLATPSELAVFRETPLGAGGLAAVRLVGASFTSGALSLGVTPAALLVQRAGGLQPLDVALVTLLPCLSGVAATFGFAGAGWLLGTRRGLRAAVGGLIGFACGSAIAARGVF